ncbi:YitT family protein [Salirhabdus sp. Marseille-P4669]|uniref:YitT family protein n=1 Tax=Salirhabdus sp. Marseille-P4669 TaxID=2042310 RepID=UPI000C7D3AF8|nr:YitT family protein [Salirhabdus sp. Marseille-P4669]
MFRKNSRQPLSDKAQVIQDYVYVILGSFFIAFAFNLFLLPNDVASGGVAGISIILDEIFGIEPAFSQWGLNVPLFLAGVIILGANFGIKSLVGTLALPLFVYVTKDFTPATMNPLLGSIFGGMGVGMGLGIVFRGRASTGGIDVAAQILHKYTGISLGLCIAIFDGSIVLTSAFVFNVEQALYALIGLFATSRTIDLIQVGFTTSKNVMIISDKVEEMRKAIFVNIDRGVTILNGEGGYTGEQRSIIMCVVDQKEFTKLTKTVNNVDSKAFVIAMSAAEVLGEGFKSK